MAEGTGHSKDKGPVIKVDPRDIRTHDELVEELSRAAKTSQQMGEEGLRRLRSNRDSDGSSFIDANPKGLETRTRQAMKSIQKAARKLGLS